MQWLVGCVLAYICLWHAHAMQGYHMSVVLVRAVVVLAAQWRAQPADDVVLGRSGRADICSRVPLVIVGQPHPLLLADWFGSIASLIEF
jgi:hypothetical protein